MSMRFVKNLFTKVQHCNRILFDARAVFTRQIPEFVNRSNNYLYRGSQQYIPKRFYQSLYNVDSKTIKKYPMKNIQILKNNFQIAKLKWTYDPDFNIEVFKKNASEVRNNLEFENSI